MNIKKYFKISLGVALLLATQISCIHDDNWDAPEIICSNKWDAPTMTMAQVVAMAPATTSGSGAAYTIPAEDATHPAVIFDAYVVSSDENGNFYKTISFQDKPENPTVGLQVGLNKSMNYADFPVGAHIRIKANGLVIGKYTGVVQLGSKDPNYTIGRIPQSIISRYMSGVCDGNGLEIVKIVPTEVTFAQAHQDKYINTLVKVKNVKFDDAVIGKALMDKDASGTAIDTNRKIVDASGVSTESALIRTDGFFRTPYTIPNSKGDITMVVSKYCTSNCTYSATSTTDPFQYIIRGINDLDLSVALPPIPLPIFEETFNDFTSNAWTIVDVSGSKSWEITSFGNPAPSAFINGLGSANEDWLISKEISLEGYTSGYFTFDTWRNYTGTTPLSVFVTTDYTGNPGTTVWTPYTPTLAQGGTFTKSGEQSLNNFMGKKIRIAFKYTNPSSSAAYAYEIDNVIVKALK